MLSTGICRWLFLLVSLATWVIVTSSKEMRVVCYYTNWSVYRPGNGKFSPQNINPYLCTHLIYAFGGFTKENTLKPFDKYQDIEKGGYAKFTGLKTYNKDLKTLLAIGGWNEGSTRFSPMVANPERRKEFARNAIKFLRLNHFDGLDLDWEYPSFRDGGKTRDKDNYPLLVKELREEFEREAEKTGRPRLLLTMAVPAGIEYINKGFDVPKLTKYLDWMNILSYDFHSAFEPAVNHHAPLYSLEEESEYNFESDLNIDYAIKHYLKSGAEPSKLVLGIPTYGRSYTLYNPDAFELGSPADGPGSMGEETRENGYLAYYEVCDYVKNQGWEVEQPNPKVMGPYAFKDNQWVGYDDEEIVKKKAEYVVENGLGGIMFWSIDNDDFRGNCHGKPYPLIEAGRAALIEAYGLTDDNLIEKPSKPLKSRTRTRTKTINKIEEPETEKPKKPTSSRRRNRTRQNKEKTEDDVEDDEISTKRKTRRKNASKEQTSSYSSLKVVTPSYTTPAPPSTPELDGGFKCEDEGFYPHPKDCKKYFWCLNGAGDSGIIAHQFTCPAGLFFNKAADSCDYSHNVLCKKSAQKASTTKKPENSDSFTTPATISFTTKRPLPKITAATSRTTLKQTTTTTTEAYEDEEYDDDDDEDEFEEEEEEGDKKESEEDPRVIKELLELIKKAGGIEELEKQFKIKGNTSSNSEHVTTKSPIFSKSLYERVLSKAIKSTSTSSRNTSFRNSRGPQSIKTEKDEKSETRSKPERGKLQYTSISRFRPSTRDKNEEETDQVLEQNTENQPVRKATEKYPSYTNIRRARVSTTTSRPESDRNKILGETDDEEEDDDDDDDEDTEDEETDDEYVLTTKRTHTPQYVNIRRQRPTTTEESSTSKYLEFRRGTTTENATSADDTHTTLKYKILRRGTTTTSKPESDNNISSSTRSKTEETTVPSTADVASRSTTVGDAANTTTEENRNEYLPIVITTTTGTYVTTTDDINLVKSENNESKSTETSNVSSKPNLINSFSRKRPQLFEPRPFSKSTEATTSRPRATQTPKVSESSYDLTSRSESENNKITKEKTNINFRSRGNSRFHPNRNVNAEENEKQVTPSRRRLIVTEKYVEENRTYRPSEIADLSSLTAVDFDNIKGINTRNNFRRRRPVKPAQTTEKVIDTQSTPNALKRRRIHVSENETTSGETKIVREYRTSSTTESSSPFTPRNRKIIRRFRTSTRASVSPQDPEEQNTIQRNRTVLNPSKSILDTPLKTNEVDDDSFEDTTTEEEENIKLSESNIRENSDINSFKPDPKLRRKLIKSDLYGKSNVYDKNLGNQQSVENETSSSIEPSTSSSTEPSIFHRTRKIIRKIVPTQPSKITDKEVDSDQIFGRKRKIIRKLRPISKISLNNTSSVQSSETKPNGTNDPIFNEEPSEHAPTSDTINEEEETPPKKIFRPKFGNRKTTSTTTELDVTTPKIVPRNKTILLRGPSRSYRPTFRPTPSDKDISSEPSVELERSSPKYNYISRRRPTTEAITEKPQIIVTTVIEEDQTDINELTTENIISTYDVEQKTTDVMITTENLLSETTSTEGNSEISTQYTDNLSTNLNIESSTKLNNAEDEELSTIVTEEPTEQSEYITDSTTELPKTTLIQTSSTVSGEPLNVTYHNTLKKVDSRPKFDPSKLNLTNSPTTEPTANVLKPKLNYKSRYQFSTSDDTLTTSTTEKINDLKESSKGNIKENNRFNRYRSGFRTTQKIRNDESLDNVESSSVVPINKYLYKTRKPKPQDTREKEESEDDTVVNIESSSALPISKSLYKFRKPKPQDIGEKEDTEDDSDKENNNKEEVSEKPKSRFFINKNTRTTKTAEIPYLSKLSTKLPSFTKTTTEASNVNDELKDINTDAVKNRNKSLFKNRKVNPNLLSPSTSPSTVAIEESTTYKDEDSTDSSTSESTEHPTTLVHIFAEKSENDQTTTSRVERLIEVNRIVNVKTKQDVLKNHHLEHSKDKESSPFYDKIGAINRVTVIKVVDKDGQLVSNETLSPVYIAESQTTESPIKSSVDMIIQIAKIQEIPPPDNKVNLTNIKVQIKQAVPVNREERRFDFIGGGKLDDSKVRNVGKAEIIDGISHINVITPRPIYLTESSTIALEGLFQTEKPTLFTSKNTINEELLETENSKYVNVRILHPDEEVRLDEDVKNTKVIPIKLLKQDEQDFIMRARVIEVSPKSPFNSIKIVPIKVETAKKMPPPLPLIRINREYN